jgi:hypothetical protein
MFLASFLELVISKTCAYPQNGHPKVLHLGELYSEKTCLVQTEPTVMEHLIV